MYFPGKLQIVAQKNRNTECMALSRRQKDVCCFAAGLPTWPALVYPAVPVCLPSSCSLVGLATEAGEPLPMACSPLLSRHSSCTSRTDCSRAKHRQGVQGITGAHGRTGRAPRLGTLSHLKIPERCCDAKLNFDAWRSKAYHTWVLPTLLRNLEVPLWIILRSCNRNISSWKTDKSPP